jgi:hypothetical protein
MAGTGVAASAMSRVLSKNRGEFHSTNAISIPNELRIVFLEHPRASGKRMVGSVSV